MILFSLTSLIFKKIKQALEDEIDCYVFYYVFEDQWTTLAQVLWDRQTTLAQALWDRQTPLAQALWDQWTLVKFFLNIFFQIPSMILFSLTPLILEKKQALGEKII